MKKTTVMSCALALLGSVFSYNTLAEDALSKAINGDHRKEARESRDQFRHPKETLTFFGLQPDMTVVEIWPGGGWYTDILAPTLKENGKLIAASFDPDAGVEYYQKALKKFKDKMASNPELYGKVEISVFQPPAKTVPAKEGSADMVLTFRNVHNWYMRGGEEAVQKSFEGFFKALKQGGVLGVVEHRLPEDRDQEKEKRSGYMKESLVIQWAEAAGFKLDAKSEINANPKDTADHPNGVWTLPPRLRAEEDKEKYQAIGESDRMTLRFVKP